MSAQTRKPEPDPRAVFEVIHRRRAVRTCTAELLSEEIGSAVSMLNDPEVKRELGIPLEVTAVAPLIVGVPNGTPLPVSRKPPAILRWVR